MLRYDMMTGYGEHLDTDNILGEYPRPQLVRDSYINLNGKWDFEINGSDSVPEAYSGSITVPFAPESVLSGVRKSIRKNDRLHYHRSFDIPAGFLRGVTLLHLDAVDQICDVYFNGVLAAHHEGGYLPVVADVSRLAVAGRNNITVTVRDELLRDYPTGKQSHRRGGIWYTPVSGIWQTVWLESAPKGYVRGLKITPAQMLDSVHVSVDTDTEDTGLTVSFGGNTVYEADGGREYDISLPGAKLWTPEQPNLYDITVTAGADTVSSYFGMRTFTVDGTHFLLNGKPYFVNGLLDQGYFSDGIYTPASYLVYRDDIAAMKELGFNTLRKHIKIEPMMFYHYCDTMGMLVLQDMVNSGTYSFLRDSALPFLGVKRLKTGRGITLEHQRLFSEHAIATQSYLYNVPAVVYYTIFNEGWGQFEGDALYAKLKELDPSRVYDTASGWFRVEKTDVVSEHIYFKPIKVAEEKLPFFVSECGGYCYRAEGHCFNSGRTESTIDYRVYATREAFEDAFIKLYETGVLANIPDGLAGTIYTQVSDVEDEVNGILTYDRKLNKLDASRVRPLMDKINSAL